MTKSTRTILDTECISVGYTLVRLIYIGSRKMEVRVGGRLAGIAHSKREARDVASAFIASSAF